MRIVLDLLPEEARVISAHLREQFNLLRDVYPSSTTQQHLVRSLDYVAGKISHQIAIEGPTAAQALREAAEKRVTVNPDGLRTSIVPKGDPFVEAGLRALFGKKVKP